VRICFTSGIGSYFTLQKDFTGTRTLFAADGARVA
jgi:hypothetical protein